MYNQLFFKLS